MTPQTRKALNIVLNVCNIFLKCIITYDYIFLANTKRAYDIATHRTLKPVPQGDNELRHGFTHNDGFNRAVIVRREMSQL